MECVDLGQAYEQHIVDAINKLTQPVALWAGFHEQLKHKIQKSRVKPSLEHMLSMSTSPTPPPTTPPGGGLGEVGGLQFMTVPCLYPELCDCCSLAH